MNYELPLRRFLTLLPLALTLSGCITEKDYQELQRKYSEAKQQIAADQEEIALQAKKSAMAVDRLNAADAEAQRAKQEVEDLKRQLESLRREFEGFKEKRRAAMTGKSYPELVLSNGRKLINAAIKEFNLSVVTFTHQGGIARVAMRELTDDIRWDACWSFKDAEASDAALAAEQAKKDAAGLAAAKQEQADLLRDKSDSIRRQLTDQSNLVVTLNNLLANQRLELNQAYATVFKGVNLGMRTTIEWNSGTPEASPLLNDFSKKPAVLGMSSLESKRDEILATLRRLKIAGGELARLQATFRSNAGR